MHVVQNATFFQTLTRRPRRNRQSPALRNLLQETRLSRSDFILPLFVREGTQTREPIPAMPGVDRLSPDLILRACEKALTMGVSAAILFPVITPALKDPDGSQALRDDNLVNSTIRLLKQELPELCVMVDIALDPYTSHGHDGIVSDAGEVMNDATLIALGEQALTAARAGVDVVAPSDMMDGRIGYIRQQLDEHGFHWVGILSYAAKYASAFYGPYREALRSTPSFGDKKTYQMNPANCREARLECALDVAEGADMLMIKPALPYLDVLAQVRAQVDLPMGAFHVSGEYAMVMAAAERGWLDADKAFYECLLGIKRAGADFIISYAALRPFIA
jgi:porphobilinogen synthase